jgi:alpha-amylase/alpha-mannosidase (GH57 family)
MAAPLHVAFIWHQHQPIYKKSSWSSALEGMNQNNSPQTITTQNPTIYNPTAQRITNIGSGGGKYHLPWVRLHGVKDYLDLVLLLDGYPSLHQTVNLVPSLLLQLQDYVRGVAFDPYLELTLTPVHALTDDQKQFIASRFFDAHHPTMVEPYPRYAQLLQQQQTYGIPWCVNNWQPADFSDLLAWHNLAWIDPLFRECDPEIGSWFNRGMDFTLSDRQRIYSKQREIIAQIVPQHLAMQQKGQLEIITSPYTHPILPLLADNYAGRVAVPQMLLPGLRFQWEQDINLHLTKAKQVYQQFFGSQPQGLWPSEQSVSPAMLTPVVQQGFQWMCSDEAVLGWSLGHYFRRDGRGRLQEPHRLYQPYVLETIHGNVSIVFRDHHLSDLIGFSYANVPPDVAANDLCSHLLDIHTAQTAHLAENPQDQPWLVTIALDGENCWEFYPQDGNPFLHQLYRRLEQLAPIECVTVSEFLTAYPPTETIPPHQLHSGSWIDANFTTWVGDPIKNRAWDLLSEARQTIARHPEATQENNPELWEHLLAAEGSDWFWWFGEGHSSNQDAIFDQLFREHLQAIYTTLNEPIPTSLLYPLEPHNTESKPAPFAVSTPLLAISPQIDGYLQKKNPTDWTGAGKIDPRGTRGTMHQNLPIGQVLYGYNDQQFCLRVEWNRHDPSFYPGFNLERDLKYQTQIHLLWFYPGQQHYISPISTSPGFANTMGMPDLPPLNYLFHHHCAINFDNANLEIYEATAYHQWYKKPTKSKIAVAECLELSIPWYDLVMRPHMAARLILVLTQENHYVTAMPHENTILIEVL